MCAQAACLRNVCLSADCPHAAGPIPHATCHMLPAPDCSLSGAAWEAQPQVSCHCAGHHFASVSEISRCPAIDCACLCCHAGHDLCQQEQWSTQCCHPECCSRPCPRTILFGVPRCSRLILPSLLHFSLPVTHRQSYVVQSFMQYGTVSTQQNQASSSRIVGACHIVALSNNSHECLMKGKPSTADHVF